VGRRRRDADRRAARLRRETARTRLRVKQPVRRFGQRLEPRDHIEELLVDATLAQTVEHPLKGLQNVVDVLVGAFHRRQTARVLAREGSGARPEKRDEQVLADQRAQGHAASHDLGQILRRPGKSGQPALPVFVQRKQSLPDGLINRPGDGAVVKKVEFDVFILILPRHGSQKNLPNERGDRLDRKRHAEETGQRQPRIRQARINALANGPYLMFSGQVRKRLDRIISHHVIELPHQPLVGTEHDGDDRPPIGAPFLSGRRGRRSAFPETRAQP